MLGPSQWANQTFALHSGPIRNPAIQTDTFPGILRLEPEGRWFLERRITGSGLTCGTPPASERDHHSYCFRIHYDSVSLARIQNDGMLGLSEYERQVRNAEVGN